MSKIKDRIADAKHALEVVEHSEGATILGDILYKLADALELLDARVDHLESRVNALDDWSIEQFQDDVENEVLELQITINCQQRLLFRASEILEMLERNKAVDELLLEINEEIAWPADCETE